MKRFVLGLIRVYQYVSPLRGWCRFTPTCSQYSYGAIARYGIIRGSILGLKRVLRCHPWNKGGFDPIP